MKWFMYISRLSVQGSAPKINKMHQRSFRFSYDYVDFMWASNAYDAALVINVCVLGLGDMLSADIGIGIGDVEL